MMEDVRIGWICNSSIVISETFLVDNYEILNEIGTIDAHCGETSPSSSLIPQFHYHHWHEVSQTLPRTILSKAMGRNRVNQLRQRRCTNALLKPLSEFNPHLLWVEFGTTAHIAQDLLTRLNKPFIINVHGFDVSRQLLDEEYRSSLIRLANRAAKVVTASHFIANKLVALGIQEQNIAVIPLIVSVQPPPLVTKTQQPSFVYFGRLSEVKGVHVLLRAFQKALNSIPTARLTIIGHGEHSEELHGLSKELNLDPFVTFLGAMERLEAHRLMAEHWVMCQANVTSKHGEQEAFGLSIAEAAGLGLPIIATNYGGIPEHVENGQSGILVPEWDYNALASAMIALAQDPDRRQRMGVRGKTAMASKFQRHHRMNAISSLIRNVI